MTLVQRRLGSTGISVSLLGLGTVKFGRNAGVKYPGAFELPSDAGIAELLNEAKNLGINLIDTAPAYGSSETRIGEILKQRSDWIISTKVGEKFEQGQSSFDFSATAARESVSRSLDRLQTDYLDVVMIHTNDDDLAALQAGALQELQRLKQDGIIRAIGASTKTLEAGLWANQEVDVLMVVYQPDDTSQQPVLEAALESGTGILIKKALNSGHADQIDQSLRFVQSHAAVSSIIVGTLNPSHLRDNAATLSSIS